MTEKQLNEVRMKIADKVKRRRAELDISQEALATQTGLGLSTIKRFESGRFWLNLKQYIIIRYALNLPDLE